MQVHNVFNGISIHVPAENSGKISVKKMPGPVFSYPDAKEVMI